MSDDKPTTEQSLDELFGYDDRTQEQRAADRAEHDEKRNRERNESAERAFERERDRRADYLHMDARIRGIVSGEITKLFYVGLFVWLVYSVGGDYGWPAGAAVIAIGAAIWWWEDRRRQSEPKFQIEEIDQLAEDTVTHERITAWEIEGKCWCRIEGDYLHWEEFFDYPHWDDVNRRVRKYASMSHRERVSDNRAARDASLLSRRNMSARLRECGEDWELPYWARLDAVESSVG